MMDSLTSKQATAEPYVEPFLINNSEENFIEFRGCGKPEMGFKQLMGVYIL